ncbi:MAG: two-component system histidine kinase PnpS [Thermoanaerobacteraceae bacterium]
MFKKLYCKYFLITLLGILISSIFFLGYVSIERFIIAVLIGIAITNFFGYRLFNNISFQIKEITHVAEDISKGIYEHSLERSPIDEFNNLSLSINSMSYKFKETIETLYDRNAKLEAVLKSIVNGVIAFDLKERILLINDSAKRMLNVQDEDIIGRHILDVIRNSKLHDIFEEIIKNKNTPNESQELNIFNKTLKTYTSPIIHQVTQEKIGFVLVINDITEMKKLEQIRSEFVANVSHELRTPLTSIRGFLETLRNGAIDNPQTRDKFLDIIDFESERLTRLINDILTLSEIENVKDNFLSEKIDIDKEIEDIVYIMKDTAKNKDILLITDLECRNVLLQTSKDRFRQMMINLIDNGIKYTPSGGFVKIITRQSDRKIIIIVEDSGIGIAKENIPRLFERFYRVDKSRSRKLGGTGLGLAIVKHIVESMKGNIKVESQLGKGTKFTIVLNKNITN